MSETTHPDLWGVLSRRDDGPAVTLEHTFRTGADDLWQAVTDPERISRWMAPTTVDGPPAVGARYVIDFGGDGSSRGAVTRCEAPTGYEVTWELDGEPDSVVAVRVAAAPGGAVLRIEHTRLPANQAHGHAAGWQAHLAALGAQLEGGPAPDWDELFGALLPAYRATHPEVAAR
jgi:uncharacterized protein YndB with AHSA1/START domain